ncbi:MAG: nucleoside monophosphate kinase [Patescibacteria group bacterium]
MSHPRNLFPLSLYQTKVAGLEKKFNLMNPEDRREYFMAKVGSEIKNLQDYFTNNTFIAYWLGKKNSGKGTYSKLIMEIFGAEKISHISVGDLVRRLSNDLNDPAKKDELLKYFADHYRGYMSVDDCIKAFLSRDTASLLPNEFVLTLVKHEIDTTPKKIIFIDGFPRNLDQVSYSLYFRSLIDYRQDPDIFIAIDIPENVIDERMKYRVVCPICQTPRSLKLLATPEVGYDEAKKEFYLMCDNPNCNKARMIAKEGDNLGIEAIRERLEMDDALIEKVFSIHGIPKIMLRNSIPVAEADKLIDSYEITPSYEYALKDGKPQVSETPYVVKDDEGVDSYSLMAPAVVITLIKQLHSILIKK